MILEPGALEGALAVALVSAETSTLEKYAFVERDCPQQSNENTE